MGTDGVPQTEHNRKTVNYAKSMETFGLLLWVVATILEWIDINVFPLNGIGLFVIMIANVVILIYSFRKKERYSAMITLGLMVFMLLFALIYLYVF